VAIDRSSRYDGATQGTVCPKCGGSVQRIRRRWIDRLASAVVGLHRYRCHSLVCGWEGNLRRRR
jgi:predicted RNA-binding Zn-ribbon protein involved in translation (DUF1610 family)